MSSRFEVELDELRLVETRLRALLADDFGTSGGLGARSFHATTGADGRQAWSSLRLRDGGDDFHTFGTFDDAELLEEAHAAVQRAVLDLLDAVHGAVAGLEAKVAATRARYAGTEESVAAAVAAVGSGGGGGGGGGGYAGGGGGYGAAPRGGAGAAGSLGGGSR